MIYPLVYLLFMVPAGGFEAKKNPANGGVLLILEG